MGFACAANDKGGEGWEVMGISAVGSDSSSFSYGRDGRRGEKEKSSTELPVWGASVVSMGMVSLHTPLSFLLPGWLVYFREKGKENSLFLIRIIIIIKKKE